MQSLLVNLSSLSTVVHLPGSQFVRCRNVCNMYPVVEVPVDHFATDCNESVPRTLLFFINNLLYVYLRCKCGDAGMGDASRTVG